MLAGCAALQVSKAWLVCAGSGEPPIRCIRNTGVEVVEYPIDISQDPSGLLAPIENLRCARGSIFRFKGLWLRES